MKNIKIIENEIRKYRNNLEELQEQKME